MGKNLGFGRSTKVAHKTTKYFSKLTEPEKQANICLKSQKKKFKRIQEKDKKMKDAIKKYLNETSKAALSACTDKTPYPDRVSRIEAYRKCSFNKKVFTLEDFVAERYDIILEWCYICHRTLFSKQAAILRKEAIKSEVPKEHLDLMPDKMVVCYRCKNVMSTSKKIPSQAFWNKLNPGEIPDVLNSLTSMEVRLIQRIIPFMKIVKYQGRFGQYGMHGQAVLFAQDVTEVMDILPRKPNSMGLMMVVESLKNIERQREMIINKERLQKALNWLCEHNERYKDVKIDLKALENLKVDYSEICTVAPPKENEEFNDQWKILNIPGTSSSSIVKSLHCKRHELSAVFNEHGENQSLAMCVSSLVLAYFKSISMWDPVDLDTALEEGHSLYIDSMEETNSVLVTFDTIKRCFTLFDHPVEIAFIDKSIFKRDQLYENVKHCFDVHTRGVIYTNKVYIAIIQHNDEFFFFDARPRGPKGYACTMNKKNEYNGSAIVMYFTDFNLFIKRLEAQLKATNTTEYTLAYIIISPPTNEGFVSTFGDISPSLHTNPVFKVDETPQSLNMAFTPEIDLSNLTERLTLNNDWPLFASHSQADRRYGANSNMQCTAMSCTAIIRSLITPLNSWTTQAMDNVLYNGNQLYIELCNKLRVIRFTSATEYEGTTNIFDRQVSLRFQWHRNLPIFARQLQEAVVIHFEGNGHTNAVLTCESKSYAILYDANQYWFFDSHSNPPNQTAVLHRTNLNGLVRLLNDRINNSESITDFSSVEVTFSEQDEYVVESRLEYIGKGKQKHPLSETSRPHEVLKKIKLNNLEDTVHETPTKANKKFDDFQEIIDENDGMSPYCLLYDTRNAKNEDISERFIVTPWKNEPKSDSSGKYWKRRLNLFTSSKLDPEIETQESMPAPAEMREGNEISSGYVTTATPNERYCDLAKLNGFDILACMVAILNFSVDSFTGWSTNRLHNVLDEAERVLSSFELHNDSLTVFGETFNYDKFFYGKSSFSDLKQTLKTFFQIHDCGLLRYRKKDYSISFMNGYYCFFDPHSCNSNGYPAENGTSCVILTDNINTLMDIISDRLAYDDTSLKITLENKEQFIIHAMQVERINDTNMVQTELNYDNLSSPIVLRSSRKHNFVNESEHLCAAVAALATNSINSFDIWSPEFIDLIQNDGAKISRNLKSNKKLDIENDFKMFSASRLNLQTSLSIVVNLASNDFKLSDILSTYFSTNDSGLIFFSNKYFSVMQKDGHYCLFDSHENHHPGYERKACAIIVKTLLQLEDLILTRSVKQHSDEVGKIVIYRLELTMVNGLDFVTHSKDLNQPKAPEVEIDTAILDAPIDCPVSLMMRIDNIVPKTEEFLEVNIENKDINSEDIPLISIKRDTKPPLNHKTIRRFEEYCFPVQFPFGINGLNEERPIKMTPLQYFQCRIMNKDSRFHSKEYLLFALNYVESEKLNSNISVCAKIQQNHQNITNVASSMHLVMRTIRGTSAYWGNTLLDLLAMVKVLGPGTAFLTLSCNDLNWDFMLKACLQAEGRGNVDPSTLSPQERQYLVENNPVMVSRLFNREIQNMLKLLKNGQALDPWKVTDYWYRIEWQQRGSPHCHMIIWIKDFPKLNTPEGIKAMEELCRCDIPEDDIELADLVKRYQRHHCKETCFKYCNKTLKEDDTEDGSKEAKVKTEKRTKTCRFSFPRPVSKETKVLDPETTEFVKNGHRLVKMKRQENAKYINNYNGNILRIWQANMDFQFITSQSIIAYVAKYSCKSEPSSLHKLINEAIKEAQDKNEETRKTLFKLTMKILNERQVSCCEGATRLCHLPMKGCSRKVVFINSSRSEERYRMLNLQSSNPENNSYFSNIIDRYQLRPDNLEEMSLAEFAMEYQPHYMKKDDKVIVDEEDGDYEFIAEDEIPENAKKPIKLKDGRSFIKKRMRSAVFRSRYFSLADNRANYFYGLLLLHLPFRSESDLMQKLRDNDDAPIERHAKDDTDLAFFEKRHLLRPFNDSCTVEEYLQYSLELQDAIRQMEALMNGLDDAPEEDNTDEQNQTQQDDIRDGNFNHVEPELPSADLLNSDQRKLFQLVQEWIRADYRNEKLSQIMMFTTGSAGTGKSFLIAQIIKIVKDYFEPKHPNSRVIFVTAPTGIAARLINGQTLHSALSLGIELGEVSKYKPLTGNYLKQRRELWKNVKFLIIDEISMVSYEMLKNIDLRLKELMNNDQPFGGINVLVFGDLMQLPPVLGHCIYDQPHYAAELHLWRLFDFCELKKNQRQKNDQAFVDLLNALRVGELTSDHRKMLIRRVENENLKHEGIFDDMCATLIAPINKTVEAHNTAVLQKLIAKNCETEKEKYRKNPEYQGYYTIRAIDELQVKTKDPDWEKYIPKEDNKCAGVPKELKLAIGARVMLRRNIDVSSGLVNGSLGVIKSFNWGGCFLKDQSEVGDLPETVLITFDGIGDRDIRPQRCEFNAKGGLGKVDRLQLPLILAWAVTAHKLQGVTVETAVVDLGSTIFEKGQAYVMLSRAKNLEKVLILRNFDVTKLEKKYVNNKAITEMNRLRELQQVEWNSLIQPRELSDSRKKLN